jgi:signal transduction histidine kinase
MAPERNGDETVEQLRAKYAQLAAKYAALVERLQNGTPQNAALFRLRWLDMNAAAAAIALVEGGKVTVATEGWRSLSPAGRAWILQSQDGAPVRTYADSSALAVGEAKVALAAKSGTSLEVFGGGSSATVLQVRAEVLSSRDARVLVLATDVTAAVHREVELQDMREALLEKEHLRILGELTTSVTHDLGNTLRAIRARLEALALDPALATRRTTMEAVSDYVGGALAQLRDLHRLARSGRLTPVPVQIEDVVRHASAVLRLEDDPDRPIELTVKLDGIPPVIGTPAELSHLFLTLLRNAKDAMPRGGRISVVARRRPGSVTICVRDEGDGIPTEALPHLFEPFFTTKGDSGTGLGLWLAASTMRRLGGLIRARNRRGPGAEFILRFPLAGRARHRLKTRAKAPRAPRSRRAPRVPA